MSLKDSCSCALDTVSFTIPGGSSMSETINVGGLRPFCLIMPSAWTTANLTFQASYDAGTTWNNLYDINGNEIVASAAASRCITMDPVPFASTQYLRVRSGVSGLAVAQGADRLIKLILRAI